MARKAFVALLFLLTTIPLSACAHARTGNMVDVRIVSDRGGEFTKYRTYPRVYEQGTYFYVEAVKGERYAVQVANQSDRRIGVVIAVDGRNIIDGRKSELRCIERMYILGPHETNTFEGWRTGMDRTNRFYFAEQSDSYAEKVFSDASAMGTIALAVYRERLPEPMRSFDMHSRMNQAPAGSVAPAPMESRTSDRVEKKSEQPGTGFGETTYSPVRVVQFDPERTSVEKIVMKYEWRSELCRKGIIGCEPKNRFWPDPEFAPVPRDFRG